MGPPAFATYNKLVVVANTTAFGKADVSGELAFFFSLFFLLFLVGVQQKRLAFAICSQI